MASDVHPYVGRYQENDHGPGIREGRRIERPPARWRGWNPKRIRGCAARRPGFAVSGFRWDVGADRRRSGIAATGPHTAATLKRMTSLDSMVTTIVSGRAVEDLYTRIQLEGLIYAGNHGLEIFGRGLSFVAPDTAALREPLARLCEELTGRLRAFEGTIVEIKGLTASVHFRRAAADPADIEDTVRTAVCQAGGRFRLNLGHKVWEIIPRSGWHKGMAVEWINRQLRRGNENVVALPGRRFRPTRTRFRRCPTGSGESRKRIADAGVFIACPARKRWTNFCAGWRFAARRRHTERESYASSRHSRGVRVFTGERLVVLTGRKASNLEELLFHLSEVSGSCIFYHTHYLYLTSILRSPGSITNSPTGFRRRCRKSGWRSGWRPSTCWR